MADDSAGTAAAPMPAAIPVVAATPPERVPPMSPIASARQRSPGQDGGAGRRSPPPRSPSTDGSTAAAAPAGDARSTPTPRDGEEPPGSGNDSDGVPDAAAGVTGALAKLPSSSVAAASKPPAPTYAAFTNSGAVADLPPFSPLGVLSTKHKRRGDREAPPGPTDADDVFASSPNSARRRRRGKVEAKDGGPAHRTYDEVVRARRSDPKYRAHILSSVLGPAAAARMAAREEARGGDNASSFRSLSHSPKKKRTGTFLTSVDTGDMHEMGTHADDQPGATARNPWRHFPDGRVASEHRKSSVGSTLDIEEECVRLASQQQHHSNTHRILRLRSFCCCVLCDF